MKNKSEKGAGKGSNFKKEVCVNPFATVMHLVSAISVACTVNSL
jgi:hypothetical protein